MARLTGEENVICDSDTLTECGRGVRFTVRWHEALRPAFVIRFHGRISGYLNRCSHRQIELDWEAGEFFDFSRQTLICATHGARYAPDSGACLAGPCAGAGLIPLGVGESGGKIFLEPADAVHLVQSNINSESNRPVS